MNNNIDLTKILKDCPEGFELYSIVHGKVMFEEINRGSLYPIIVSSKEGELKSFTADGKMLIDYDGECCLFPSKYCHVWSNFVAPWCKKEKFDPKTLKPFDKVLAKIFDEAWYADFVSVPSYDICDNPVLIGYCKFDEVIPYNNDTKHLLGTTDEAPEYYRYWED